MKCEICGSERIKISYHGLIRDGGLGKYTDNPVTMFRCLDCGVIWHEQVYDNKEYYESEKYRENLEGTSEEEEFYRLHDKESMDKFFYTGTEIFRKKIVADIGCGCGAFLDYLRGVADKVIAIEPSEKYRNIMKKKKFYTYAYSSEAHKEWHGKINIITSFDVIEHVQNPKDFIHDVYELLSYNGKAIIGTPTDAPIMRKLLGEVYEKELLFSTQHLWIFSEESLRLLAEQEGFAKISVKYFQRYGIGNMVGWIRDKKPGTAIQDDFISETLNTVWKSQCSENGLADYIVLYLQK